MKKILFSLIAIMSLSASTFANVIATYDVGTEVGGSLMSSDNWTGNWDKNVYDGLVYARNFIDQGTAQKIAAGKL